MKIGTKEVSNIFVGTKQVDRIYIGTELAYSTISDYSEGLEYSYNKSNGTYTVTGIGSYAGDNLIIPDTYNDGVNGRAKVTRIDSYAFYECNGIKNVTIGANITDINYGAFARCKGLNGETIMIPSKVSSISGNVFFGSGIASFEVDEDNNYYKTIDNNLYSKDGTVFVAFATQGYNNGVGKFVFPEGVTTISDGAFYYCTDLESIILPVSLIRIKADAFYYCTNLKMNPTIGCKITHIEEKAFYWCNELNFEFNTGGFNNLYSIGDMAFYGASFTKLNFLNTKVYKIGERALFGSSVNELYLSSTIKRIGATAFSINSGAKVTFSCTRGWHYEKDNNLYGISSIDLANDPINTYEKYQEYRWVWEDPEA